MEMESAARDLSESILLPPLLLLAISLISFFPSLSLSRNISYIHISSFVASFFYAVSATCRR